jgi:hypothetical protein
MAPARSAKKGTTMTEAEWLEWNEPGRMLQHVRDKASRRKLRLFAVACCCRLPQLLTKECRDSLEIAEQFAEGLVTQEVRQKARAFALESGWVGPPEIEHELVANARGPAKDAVCRALQRQAFRAAAEACESACEAAAMFTANQRELQEGPASGDPYYGPARVAEETAQCRLLRCIIGDPRRIEEVNENWLEWNGGTTVRIARAIYDERAFDRLPVLADALEDAGCDDADILRHCREPGEHVRGCWVVDLLLGKS